MTKIKINTLTRPLFTLDYIVRIADINYGNHLGHDRIISLLHDIRAHFFKKLGYTELNIEGVGIIVTDLAVEYKREAFFGDVLRLSIGVNNISRTQMEFVYEVSYAHSASEIARATTTIAYFDYSNRKVVRIPEAFLKKIQALETNLII